MVTWSAAMFIAGLVLGVISLFKKWDKKKTKQVVTILTLVLLGLPILAYMGVGPLQGLNAPLAVIPEGVSIPTPSGDNGAVTTGTETYQPTASYATKDKFSTTSVSGTAYYKVNDLPATTTAKTNVRSGEKYTYWVSNDTYYVEPVVFVAKPGANDIVADAWQNASATITGYDTVNHQTTTNGAYNTSMGANDQANIQITYQGTAKKSAGPFGGVMVLEYNSTISSVTCTGDYLLSDNPYHLTYTTSATTHTYKAWAYSSEVDDGSGAVRTFDCQFKNGASAVGAGSAWYVKFIPANYYVTNDGDIVLDVEKFENDDTTRTGLGTPSATFYWGA